MTKRAKPADYSVVVTALSGGRLVMLPSGEENARPWLRMLRRAGIVTERTPNGRHMFTFDGRPDLTGEEAATAGAASPGPWQLDGGQLRDRDGNSIASFPYTLGGAEDHANAQLVRAAPELAEALHFMCAAVRTHYDPVVIESMGILAAALGALQAAGWDPDKPRRWGGGGPA